METARHLPADLVPEILCCLPVKSLMRFRCVAKSWLSLVDNDANFAQLHLKTFKNNSDQTRLFTVQRKIDGKKVSEVRCSNTFELIPDTLPISETPRYDSMSSYSLDGLILLKFGTDKTAPFCDLKVWNPSIGKLRQIPRLTIPELSYSRFLGGKDIGLGYDPVTNDYKIVRLIAVKSLSLVAIYPLATGGSWRIVEIKGVDWRWNLFNIEEGVYFGSSLYFIARDKRGGKVWELVSFDLSKEVFSSVIIPDEISLRLNDCYAVRLELLDVGLSLQVQERSSDDIYVWMVDTDLMRWNKPLVYSLNFYCHSYIKDNGDILTWRYKLKNHFMSSDVGIYGRETKEHKALQEEEGDFLTCHNFWFVESLILHQQI